MSLASNNLSGWNFVGQNLSGVNFAGANVTGRIFFRRLDKQAPIHSKPGPRDLQKSNSIRRPVTKREIFAALRLPRMT